jgi:hypothetical protein
MWVCIEKASPGICDAIIIVGSIHAIGIRIDTIASHISWVAIGTPPEQGNRIANPPIYTTISSIKGDKPLGKLADDA